MIQTERLIIRDLKKEDANRFSEYRSKKSVSKYQSWTHYSVFKARRRIEYCLKHPLSNQKGDYQLGVTLKDNDYLIGDIYIEIINSNKFSIGYTFDEPYWHQGYASEAVSTIIDYLEKNYHFKSCLGHVYNDNLASIKLLEKLGFKKISISSYDDDSYYQKILER